MGEALLRTIVSKLRLNNVRLSLSVEYSNHVITTLETVLPTFNSIPNRTRSPPTHVRIRPKIGPWFNGTNITIKVDLGPSCTNDMEASKGNNLSTTELFKRTADSKELLR